ncbi:MAG: DNA methylase, partial [Firmicutes bacterium]|nr:DNA methylase [Bacillota bacterium]
VNAELLIDHAWGVEPCTMQDIKNYRPKSNSISSGQVLPKPYDFKSAKMIVREMAELLSLDMVEKKVVSEQINLYIRYNGKYGGPVMYASGSAHLGLVTSSSEVIADAAVQLFEEITDRKLYVRAIYITATDISVEGGRQDADDSEQLSMFVDYKKIAEEKKQRDYLLREERKEQRAMLEIKSKFGKNGIFKAADLQEDATTLARNAQIGGHNSD